MSKPLAAARILASLPLLVIGAMHLFGQAPLGPILEGAGLPMPELTEQLAPIIEVLAGLLLLTGYQPRLGALLGIVSMAGALAAHLKFDHENFQWADEPPIAMPIAIIVLCVLVLVKGGGAWCMKKKSGT